MNYYLTIYYMYVYIYIFMTIRVVFYFPLIIYWLVLSDEQMSKRLLSFSHTKFSEQKKCHWLYNDGSHSPVYHIKVYIAHTRLTHVQHKELIHVGTHLPRFVTEVVQGIRVAKLYAWEEAIFTRPFFGTWSSMLNCGRTVGALNKKIWDV